MKEQREEVFTAQAMENAKQQNQPPPRNGDGSTPVKPASRKNTEHQQSAGIFGQTVATLI